MSFSSQRLIHEIELKTEMDNFRFVNVRRFTELMSDVHSTQLAIERFSTFAQESAMTNSEFTGKFRLEFVYITTRFINFLISSMRYRSMLINLLRRSALPQDLLLFADLLPHFTQFDE